MKVMSQSAEQGEKSMNNLPLHSVLFGYLARRYAVNFVGLLAILLGVVALFDFIELFRRASKYDDIALSVLLKMEGMRLPELSMTIAPFTILFAALFTFWQLARTHELVVLRAAGISAWQFLGPLLASAFLVGVVAVMIFDPVGAVFYGRYDELNKTLLKRENTNIVAMFDEGMWLRQETSSGYAILHAAKIEMPEWRLHQVMMLFFGPNDQYQERLDSPSAILKNHQWVFRDSVINREGKEPQRMASYTLETPLTLQDIEESFSSPETIGFWSLPGMIKTMELTGFDATRIRLHFQELLALPFLFAAMVLLAACVSLRQSRQGGNFNFILIGVIGGFIIFFFSNFLHALGASHQLPIFLAAWSPALLATLLGVTILLSLEDG